MGKLDDVVALELELLDPVCRADPDRLVALLTDDFEEIGQSGRVWTRNETIAALTADPAMDDVTIGPMSGQRVAPEMAAVRYTTRHQVGPGTVRTVHRTGWWRQTSGEWQCWFHQATVVVEPAGEVAAVTKAERPTTRDDVEQALRTVGVTPGSTVIVHCALSQLGWVIGNAVAVVHALRSVVGPDGTIVMPAQTGVGDPSHWQAPPVPEGWWSTIRDHWPAFDPLMTPMRGMGAVAECFARLPGVVHSGHPAVGFVAHGPRAVELMHPHSLDDGFGDGSPLARLHDVGADIVLLGVGHANNTSLHLAEARALGDAAPTILDGAPLVVGGHRQWVEYTHIDYDESDFALLGDAYTASGGTEQRAPLGGGEVRRVPMPELVDFAVDWIVTRRLGRPTPAE